MSYLNIIKIAIVSSAVYATATLAQSALADWDLIYDMYGDASTEHALDVVSKCPVSYYFDTHRGFYRVGFLSSSLNGSFSDYVSVVPRMYRGPDLEMRTELVETVDSVSLFSEALLAIQNLGILAERISDQMNEFKKEKDNFALKIIRIATDTGKEWRTANEIRAAREVLQRRLDGMREQMSSAERIHALKKENVNIRHSKRRSMRVDHHEKLLALRVGFEAEMVALKLQRQNESLAFSKEMQNSKYKEKERMIEEEYRFAMEQLMNEIEMSISAIRFRGQEESRVERENEAVTMALMQAKGELQVQRVQAVLDTFFIEIETKLHIIFEDPKIVGIGAVVVVGLLALIVFLTEIFNSGKAFLRALMRRNSLLTQVGTVSASSASSSGAMSPLKAVSIRGANAEDARAALSRVIGDSIVLSFPVERRFVDIVTSILLSKEYFSAGDRMCHLPNVLISSPHGNGKSMAANLLVRCAGIEFAVISGNDLRAHGAGADRTFRNILEACVAKSVKKQKQFMLVIDDVDAIALSQVKSHAGTRSPAKPGSSKMKKSLSGLYNDRVITDMTANLAPSMKACIHLMLHTFKNSNAFLGLVITSTAPVEALNEALLDRMDHVVSIEMPSVEQRLLCCMRQTSELLSGYMSNADREVFKTIYDTVVINKDFSILNENESMTTDDRGSTKSAKKKATSRKSMSKVESAVEDEKGNSKLFHQAIEFNVKACILDLAISSGNWSYRDVTKTIQSIQCEVLGTTKCIVTTSIWMQEVKLAVQKWER